jgi:hypothetical protein
MRQRLAQLLHDPRQQIGADGGDQAQFEFAGERIGVVARQRDDFIALVQHAARAHHDLFTHFGELNVLRLALHQFDAQIVLELLELRREGGLADEGALGGLAKMPGIGQRHQVFQVLEIHGSAPIVAVSIDRVYQLNEFNQSNDQNLWHSVTFETFHQGEDSPCR